MKQPKTKNDFIKLKRKLEANPDTGELFYYMTVEHFTKIISCYFNGNLKKQLKGGF